jgi:hypothetical protein
MGALIQTKGTQLLAKFLSIQFGSGDYLNEGPVNLNWFRSKGAVKNDIQFSPSLFRLSQLHRNDGPLGMALFYPFSELTTNNTTAITSPTLNFGVGNVAPWVTPGAGIVDETTLGATTGLTVNTVPNSSTVTMSNNANIAIGASDKIVFLSYPYAAAQSTATGAGLNTLNLAAVPTGVAVGMGVVDYTASGAIQLGTVVAAPITGTAVNLSNPTAQAIPANHSIGFIAIAPTHANLQRRWKYFLKNELKSSCDRQIREAILEAILNTDITRVTFDAIEGTDQFVHTAIENDVTDTVGFKSLGKPYMKIVLETPPTKANLASLDPIPLDPQS